MKGIAVVLVLFILSSGFLFVYHDRSEASVYGQRLSALDSSRQEQMNAVFSYLDSKGDISFLSTAEQDHLRDVRRVMIGVRVVFVLSWIVLILAFFMKREEFFRTIRPAITGVGIFLAIIGIGSLFGFSSLWTWFHHVFFPQGNWLFASDSIIITLFPLEFFMAYALEVVVSIVAVAGFTLTTRSYE